MGPSISGGTFYDASGVAEADYLAKWDGSQWQAVDPAHPIGSNVYALAVMGDELIIGGSFTAAGGLTEGNRVIKWNTVSETWSALDTGIGNSEDETVLSLMVDGTDIYVGGEFTYDGTGTVELNSVGRWDGTDWNAYGTGLSMPEHWRSMMGSWWSEVRTMRKRTTSCIGMVTAGNSLGQVLRVQSTH